MRKIFDRIYGFIIRVSAFVRKEIVEVLRQPRLVLTLILGPFLILFLFGLGFRNEPAALRTMFVVKEGSGLAEQVQEYASSLGNQLIFAGVTQDQAEALEKLRYGQVDVVAVVPDDAYETIRNSEQAVITLYHYEIDPFQIDYVTVFGRVYVDEINRRLLQTLTQQGQTEASQIQDDLEIARTSAVAMRQALEQQDAVQARWHQGRLARHVDLASLAVGASLGLLSTTQDMLSPEQSNEAKAILDTFSSVRDNTETLNSNPDDPTNYDEDIQKLESIEQDVTLLEDRLKEFRSIQPYVVVSPFRSEVQTIAAVQSKVSDYFAPAVIVLLLQHLSLTFGALSIVREYQLGAAELFYVAPLSSFETLLGKYLSYLIFGVALTVILSLILIYVLQVPMLGNWYHYSLVMFALIFASIGIGFTLSVLSQTDSQAVQYSMIVLLTSVFFSGFFLSIESLWEPVRAVSWMLPATYAIILLQNIMLRGYLSSVFLLAVLFAMGVFFFFLSLLLMNLKMARR